MRVLDLLSGPGPARERSRHRQTTPQKELSWAGVSRCGQPQFPHLSVSRPCFLQRLRVARLADRPPPSPGGGWWSGAQAHSREWSGRESGHLSGAVPKKTEDSKTASSPLALPAPSHSVPHAHRAPHPRCLHPRLQTKETKRQGRDKARRPPRGRRWAPRPGWGLVSGLAGALQVSPGCLGDLSHSWSGELAPRRGPRRAGGTAAPEQTAGRSQAGAHDPSPSREPLATP